jgi:hypothetical protein
MTEEHTYGTRVETRVCARKTDRNNKNTKMNDISWGEMP